MVKTYIVKIYRQSPDSPRNTVGIVEEVRVEGKKAFQSYDELWKIQNLKKDLQGLLEETHESW
jgi:hypothetical protein